MAFPGRNDPTRRNARFEREVDNPFTRPQTARASFRPPDRNQSRPARQIASGTATFPRTQALSISTARPRQHSQHFEHQAFPTSPPGRKRHADATPAKPLASYPTPCPPNLQLHVHQTSNATPTRPFAFSRKPSHRFPCRGQDAQTAARPKRIPRRKRRPAI